MSKFSKPIFETIQSISAQELATEFQVADSTILRWANGTAKPHPKLQKLIMAKIKNISKTLPKIIDPKAKTVPLIDHQKVADALGAEIIPTPENFSTHNIIQLWKSRAPRISWFAKANQQAPVTQQMPNGTKVRMSQEYKNELKIHNPEHLEEFGGCIGVVGERVHPNTNYPELDVRWQPSNLRYGYFPEQLEIVD